MAGKDHGKDDEMNKKKNSNIKPSEVNGSQQVKNKKNGENDSVSPTLPKQPTKFNPFQELKKNLLLLISAVQANDKEKISRVFRNNSKIKPFLLKKHLIQAIEAYVKPSDTKSEILKLASQISSVTESSSSSSNSPSNHFSMGMTMIIEQPSENDDNIIMTDSDKQEQAAILSASSSLSSCPEVEMYLYLMVLHRLFKSDLKNEISLCLHALLKLIQQINRRMLDPFSAKVYFYFALYYEQYEKNLEIIRSTLLHAYRTACLHHDEIGQATLLNLLLRNYLKSNLVDQASKLISKTTFPEAISNNQYVRYLYYVGKVNAIQLDYTASYTQLMQAIRKAPQNTAVGFRHTIHRLAVIVQLLMGEVPERSLFHQPSLKVALAPYMELTNAVRIGSLNEFNTVLKRHEKIFSSDHMMTLILRLRHNVIKTGLRKINLSYSRISFQDICTKLALESPENTEFVCAKAILDGVIDAVIDHQNGWMQSKEIVNVYGTNEPQQAFHKRITFCLDVHNEAVKAMRYPPNAYKKDLESAQEREEREKQEEELAKEIEEEMDEEGM